MALSITKLNYNVRCKYPINNNQISHIRMTTLQDRINRLPKEVQCIIGEYNVEHRPLLKKVLKQLTETDNRCNFCRTFVSNEEKYNGLYVYGWDKHKYVYCGPECCDAGDQGILKARRRWLQRLDHL